MSDCVSYLYDGSWDGLLSAIFQAYQRKQTPVSIVPEEDAQLQFGVSPVVIQTQPDQAKRVEAGIVKKLGSPALHNISVAFLSDHPDKGTAIYNYIRAGLSMGRKIYNALATEPVLAIDSLCRGPLGEAHLLRGFVRFSLMENGVYYSKITPKSNVVPLLMPHFTDRFSDQPFLLYDAVHHIAGVYDLKEWRLVQTEELDLPPLSEEETSYRQMWKQFYHTIAVQERHNPTCRRNHMPKRFWGNMTELMADNAK